MALQSHYVITKDGKSGRIVEPLAGDMETYLVQFENGPKVALPFALLHLESDGNYHISHALADLNRTPGVYERDGYMVIPLAAEQLEVDKRVTVTGKVRVQKMVREREEVIDEPFMQERVQVERVPMQQMLDAPLEIRYEGNTVIIPVMEEVLVIEKRLMLKEEIRITKEELVGSQPQTITLRSEDVKIDREAIDSDGPEAAPSA